MHVPPLLALHIFSTIHSFSHLSQGFGFKNKSILLNFLFPKKYLLKDPLEEKVILQTESSFMLSTFVHTVLIFKDVVCRAKFVEVLFPHPHKRSHSNTKCLIHHFFPRAL
jgi:hypothetical protein